METANKPLIKIWTFGFFCKQHQPFSLPSVLDEYSAIIPEFLHNEQAIEIIESIEGSPVNGDALISKFNNVPCPINSTVSAGCKTAIVALSKVRAGNSAYIDLSECGPQALRVCLNLIADSPVIGVVSAPIRLKRGLADFRILLNDKQECHSWYGVALACKEEMNLDDDTE